MISVNLFGILYSCYNEIVDLYFIFIHIIVLGSILYILIKFIFTYGIWIVFLLLICSNVFE